jgi:hypothetical protein
MRVEVVVVVRIKIKNQRTQRRTPICVIMNHIQLFPQIHVKNFLKTIINMKAVKCSPKGQLCAVKSGEIGTRRKLSNHIIIPRKLVK